MDLTCHCCGYTTGWQDRYAYAVLRLFQDGGGVEPAPPEAARPSLACPRGCDPVHLHPDQGS